MCRYGCPKSPDCAAGKEVSQPVVRRIWMTHRKVVSCRVHWQHGRGAAVGWNLMEQLWEHIRKKSTIDSNFESGLYKRRNGSITECQGKEVYSGRAQQRHETARDRKVSSQTLKNETNLEKLWRGRLQVDGTSQCKTAQI